MPAHVKATLTGPELTLPVRDGRLALGTWQGIYLCEHRDRGGARSLLGDRLRARPERTALAALPDRVALLLERERALARVLGDQDRPGDLALLVPEVGLGPLPLLVRGSSSSPRRASGPLRAIVAASSSATSTAVPGSATRLTSPSS